MYEKETVLNEILKLRINSEDKRKLKEYAKKEDCTMSEILRNFIKSL